MDILENKIPQCMSCKNYIGWLSCEAYVDGIPEIILLNEHDHTEPYPGDNGIQFEPIEGTDE